MSGYNANDLLFVPLGGTGEIGMNLNLYHYQGKWLIVDMGVTFPDEDLAKAGIDVITPDPEFIEKHVDDVVGIVVTHAHEDHIGAIQYLWERFQCTVYATKFTGSLLFEKLKETGLARKVPIHTLPLASRFSLGPFDLEYVSLTHSIPESNALAIRTGGGNILHTGDWKFDPHPLVGDASDKSSLQEFAEEGVLALIGDSTNATVEGTSGSESLARQSLIDLFQTLKTGCIFVGCFASNIARLESIAIAAHEAGRGVYIAGRSLNRYTKVAHKSGYMKDIPGFLNDREIKKIPTDHTVVICTGSQGEPRAALSRLAAGRHHLLSIDKNDHVVFSSREIPGNEERIHDMQDRLRKMGANLYTADDYDIHVSGHPAREELREMYQIIRPKFAVPTHGEDKHLAAHAELALESGVEAALQIENGCVVKLNGDAPEVIDRVPVGRLGLNKGVIMDIPSNL